MKKHTVDLKSVVDVQENPAVIIDSEYRIIAANKSYCRSYGVTEENIVGRCCYEVSHRSQVPCHQNGEDCPHRKVFETNEPFQVLHTHYDADDNPDHVRIKAYPLKNEDGSTVLMESIYRLVPRALDISCEDMRMVGRSPAFLACIESLTVAAKAGGRVLIDGESGVGKELAARFVHDQSSRSGRPYVELNCAAITETLVEDELFGHERGAFTGCAGMKPGLFELADKGTLFLDEVGELPLAIQAKLLRVLDSGEFRRVGGQQKYTVDVNVIAATNRDLGTLVAEGKFREDLYYRIAGIRVTVPPLRERRSDIVPLAQVLIKRLTRDSAVNYEMTNAAIEKLNAHHFPGNIRELSNVIQKAIAMSDDGVIDGKHIQFDHIPTKSRSASTASPAPEKGEAAVAQDSCSIADLEATHIASLLRAYKGNRRKVASVLNISERTLYRKINRYHLRECR